MGLRDTRPSLTIVAGKFDLEFQNVRVAAVPRQREDCDVQRGLKNRWWSGRIFTHRDRERCAVGVMRVGRGSGDGVVTRSSIDMARGRWMSVEVFEVGD